MQAVTQARGESRLWNLAAIVLLFIYWFSRLHNLLTLPIFLDESSHITRAQWVWEGKPLYLLETGKALAMYVAAIFWPFSGAPFIGRFAVVLLGSIGLAAAYGVARMLHSRQAGVLTMALWIICPQLIFFERMALVDTTISSMALLTLWLAIRMMRRPARGKGLSFAVLCGLGLALCVLAKTTGLVFLPIPALVAILLPGKLAWPGSWQAWRTNWGEALGEAWRFRLRQVVIAYVVGALLLVGPLLYIRHANADPTGLSTGLTTTRIDTLITRVQENAEKLWDAEQVYYSKGMVWVILVVALVGLFYNTRTALLLLALIAAPLLAIIVTAASLWLRYASPAAPFILILTATGLLTVVRELRGAPESLSFLRKLSPVLPWAVVVAWAAFVGIPFHASAYSDPTDLNLPSGDVVEYIQWIPSGYGIRDAAAYLRKTVQTPTTIIGTAVNCNGARLYMPQDTPIKFICPDLDWGGGNWDVVFTIQMQALKAGSVLVLGEEVPIVTESQLPNPHSLLKEFFRPGGNYSVQLYRVGADQGQGADQSDNPKEPDEPVLHGNR